MSVTPSGMLSAPLAALETLLTGCQAFLDWTGAADAAAAAANVHWYRFTEAATAANEPLVVIGFDAGLEATAEDTGSYWPLRGPFVLNFEELAQNEIGVASAVNTVSDKDAITHLTNAAGAILEEMIADVVGGGKLDLTGWTMRTPPGRTADDDVKGGAADLVGMVIELQRRDG